MNQQHKYTPLLGRMYEIRKSVLRYRMIRRNQIAVAQLCLDLKEIHHAMVHTAVKRNRTRRRAERIRNADHFELVVELAADDLAHLPQRELLFIPPIVNFSCCCPSITAPKHP